MRSLPLLLIALLPLSACNPRSPAPAEQSPSAAVAGLFGDELPAGASPRAVAEVLASPEEGQELVLAGKVAKVCQASGCWLELEGAPANLTLVFETASGGEFTVPKDLAGRSILAYGRLEKVGGELQLVTRGLSVQP
jgi:hypothetical protein